MEKHFLADLVEPLQSPARAKARVRQNRPWFNPHGDCLTYQTADEAVVADRIDDFLTIYTSAIDSRPIGFQIKGVLGLLAASGANMLSINATTVAGELKEVSLSLFLLLAAYESSNPTIARREAYVSALSQAASAVSPYAPCLH